MQCFGTRQTGPAQGACNGDSGGPLQVFMENRIQHGVAAVRFLRGTLFAEVRIGIRDLRIKSAVRQTRQYALFAAIPVKPNYALFSL